MRVRGMRVGACSVRGFSPSLAWHAGDRLQRSDVFAGYVVVVVTVGSARARWVGEEMGASAVTRCAGRLTMASAMLGAETAAVMASATVGAVAAAVGVVTGTAAARAALPTASTTVGAASVW